MPDFPILDFVVGLIFIYFLLSIITSSLVEIYLTRKNIRSALLEKWLIKIFDLQALNDQGMPLGKTLGNAIMDHCMTNALSDTGKSTSYFTAANFVSALLDKITIVPQGTPIITTVGVPGVPAPTVGSGDSQVQQPPPATLAGYIAYIENTTVISGELKRTILVRSWKNGLTILKTA